MKLGALSFNKLKGMNGHGSQYIEDTYTAITGRKPNGTVATSEKALEVGSCGGRPLGSKDKLCKLRDMILNELISKGDKGTAIQSIRRTFASKPEAILGLMSKLLPSHIELDTPEGFAPVLIGSASAVQVNAGQPSIVSGRRSEGEGCLESSTVLDASEGQLDA